MREEYAERMLPTRPLEPVVMNDTNELARILISDLISELLNWVSSSTSGLFKTKDRKFSLEKMVSKTKFEF